MAIFVNIILLPIVPLRLADSSILLYQIHPSPQFVYLGTLLGYLQSGQSTLVFARECHHYQK